MQFKINGDTHEASQGLMAIICRVMHYCDEYKLPLVITEASNDCMIISTKAWSEIHINKFTFGLKRDYSDLSKVSINLVTLFDDHIKIEVNPAKKLDKFE